MDVLIEKVPVTRDQAEKKKLALEAALLAKNEYSIMAVLDLQTVFALDPNVGEFVPIKGLTDLGQVYETITHGK